MKNKNKKELFIVEGQSAASTLRQAIGNSDQIIHAIQGKLINVAKATPKKVHENTECQKIFQLLACGKGSDCQPDQLNYSRILILTDPDSDGSHSRALVLTLFDQYLKPLIDSGLVSVIIPPLFRMTWEDSGQENYAWSEQERLQLIQENETVRDFIVTRFKGVAQFSREECVRLLLHPETRKQIDIV